MSKIYNRLIWLALTVLGLSMSMNAQCYSGGAGTLASPYEIANKADLKYLCEHSGDWNKHFKQTADIGFEMKNYTKDSHFYYDSKGCNSTRCKIPTLNRITQSFSVQVINRNKNCMNECAQQTSIRRISKTQNILTPL